MRAPVEMSAYWFTPVPPPPEFRMQGLTLREGTSTKAKGDDRALSKHVFALFFCAPLE